LDIPDFFPNFATRKDKCLTIKKHYGMKTKEELQEMLSAIGEAERAYYKAIEDNLKESEKEYQLQKDWNEDEDSKGLHFSFTGRHNDLIPMELDKVRFNKDRGVSGLIEVHVCTEDYNDTDYWLLASEFGDDVQYIYDNIIW
jgi:hypothetical protein